MQLFMTKTYTLLFDEASTEYYNPLYFLENITTLKICTIFGDIKYPKNSPFN